MVAYTCSGPNTFASVSLLQIVASKYLNDEGEHEALVNSDWSEIGQFS